MKITQFENLRIPWLKNAALLALGAYLTLFSAWAQTPCTAIAANFSENFDSTTTGSSSNPSVPTCWSYQDDVTSTGYGYTNSSASDSRSQSNFYRLYRTNSTSNSAQNITLISPETVNLGGGAKQLRFYARTMSSTYQNNTLEIVRMSSNTATATVTTIATFNITGTAYQEYVVPLPLTTDDYFGFRIPHNGTTSVTYVYLDDVYYEDLETCFFPLGINSANITQNSVDISWTASTSTGVTGYEYEIRSSGAPGSGAVGRAATGTTTSTSVTNITGLVPSATYTVYVRSICGSASGRWSPYPHTFSTLCGIITGNFFEGFENTATGSSSNITYPNCWSYLNTIGSGYGYVNTTAANNGSNGFYTYRSSTASANGDLLLMSPETANLGSGTKQLRFWAKVSSASYNPDFRIYTMDGTAATATKTLVQGTIPLTTTWQEFIVPLPATTDDYFAFSFDRIGSSTSYVYLDDIYYEDISPCLFPMNIAISNITGTAATISWNASVGAGVTGYEYEVRSSGAPGSGATGLAATGTTTALSVNVTGLTGATDYTVYVRSVCGSAQGPWTTFPVEFQTACPVYGNFFEGFENTSTGSSSNITLPNCWTYINTIGSGYAYVSTTAKNNGNNGYYTYRPSTAAALGDLLLISPETDNLGNGAKQIRFWAKVSSTSYDPDFRIYTMNGTTATATKTLVQNTIPLTTTWQEFTVILPATTDDYFAFSFDRIGSSASYVYLDDIYYEDVPLPTLTTTKNDNLCNGDTAGFASVVVTGGVPPYTYAWAPSGGNSFNASNLAAGTYTVTVTDALNRTVNTSVTILEPDAIAANLVTVPVTCNGAADGSVTAAPSGGTPPYSLVWSNGSTATSITGLDVGTYTLTITDANSCTVTETVNITQPNVLVLSAAAQSDVTSYGGNDGTATVGVAGGTAPYTYSWAPSGGTSDTASGLVAGTYTVTVTDARGCKATQSFVIAQPIPLMTDTVSHTNVSCNGGSNGSATITVKGGNAPYTYSWSPSGGTANTATGLQAGTYTVTVTDATANTIKESFTITEPPVLTIGTGTVTNINCNGLNTGAVTPDVKGGTEPYTYAWSNGSVSPVADNLTAGTYTLKVTDANGCTATQSFTVTQPAVLTAVQGNVAQVSCNGKADGSATVSVTGGTAPYAYVWSNGQSGTTISNLSGGTYTVTVTDANSCMTSLTVTITEPAVVHPPSIGTQNLCAGQNTTLAGIASTAVGIKWYSAATGGTQLPLTTVLVNGTTYYASETVNGCESSYRTPVLVNLTQAVPVTTTALSVCGNSVIQNIAIDGFNYVQLRWYDSTTAVNALPNSHLLTTGTYYVSTLVNGCESGRKAVQVAVQTAVPVPVAAAQTVCNGGTVADLVVTQAPGATVKWYTTPQSTMVLSAATPLSTGTYYVEQVMGTCASLRVAVPVQVTMVQAPAITSMTLCDGATVGNLYLNGNTSDYIWYINNTTDTALPDTQFITTGTYYIAQQSAGCISARTQVAVTVNSRPGSPTGQLQQTFTFNATVADLDMNQNNVAWFATYDDAMKQDKQLTNGTPLQDGVTYYGALIGANGCSSLPTPVAVNINLGTHDLDSNELKYYPNPVNGELTITYAEPIRSIEMYTVLGQRVLSREYDAREVKVDVSALAAGTYMVRITTAQASQFVKVVKK